MDGDGVGNGLEATRDERELQDLVARLDRFAGGADGIRGAEEIIRSNFGCAFYVGGDDIACYLPVDTALKAATELAEHFAHQVGTPFHDAAPLTLSGAIVLTHAKDDLRGVRRRAKQALKEAKRARRARRDREPDSLQAQAGWLAVVERPRSGSERVCLGPLPELAQDLERWRELLRQDVLSLRSPRLLFDLADRFADPKADDRGKLGIDLARHRLLAQGVRSSKEKEEATEGQAPALAARAESLRTWRDAMQLADELAISGRLHKTAALRPVATGEAS
jgi:hypothetical protein